MVKGARPLKRPMLPPDVREALIAAIADALVGDYRRRHRSEISPPPTKLTDASGRDRHIMCAASAEVTT